MGDLTEDRARLFYTSATAWDMGDHEDRPDLAKLRKQAEREWDRMIARVKTEARRSAFQDAQQIIAGDLWVDDARTRDGLRASKGQLIRELDQHIMEEANG